MKCALHTAPDVATHITIPLPPLTMIPMAVQKPCLRKIPMQSMMGHACIPGLGRIGYQTVTMSSRKVRTAEGILRKKGVRAKGRERGGTQ